MTIQVQRRRGTEVEHTSFTGAEGEITVNTTDWSIHVHDGTTPGGHKVSLMPSGTVLMHAAQTAPDGFLICDGTAVSRTTYSDLFDSIGTTYGSGDGSTTFNLPDLRGEFVRGWDNGRGVDSGRSFGSSQDDVVGPHEHTTNGNEIVTNTGGTGLQSGGNRFWNGNFPVETTGFSSGGGTETRPRNVAMNYIIKI